MHIPTLVSLTLTLPLLRPRQTFQAYDSCAQICFDEYSSLISQCTETAYSKSWISCVCQDEIFTAASAGCIGSSCGTTILNDTATKHVSNCDANGSPPAVDAADFIAYGEGDDPSVASGTNTEPTTTKSSLQVSATQTSSSPTSASSAASNGSGSLSTAALVGTIVGSVTGAIGSFAGVYFAWKSYKLKKEEKNKEASEAQSNVLGR